MPEPYQFYDVFYKCDNNKLRISNVQYIPPNNPKNKVEGFYPLPDDRPWYLSYVPMSEVVEYAHIFTNLKLV